jgi:hypothetical protein
MTDARLPAPFDREQPLDVVVRPVRFTDDVTALRAFLTELGLVARIESERGGWVDMVAGSGMVALHDAASSDIAARPGDTSLSFACADAGRLVDRLHSAGLGDAHVIDEAYGRSAVVPDPDGGVLVADEVPHDLYGFRRLDGEVDGRLQVRVVRTTADPTALSAMHVTDPDGVAVVVHRR